MRVEARTLRAESTTGAGLCHRRNPRDHQRELRVVAAIQGQLSYLFFGDKTAYFAAPGFDWCGFRCDSDRFTHLTDLQIQVDDFVFPHVEFDSGGNCLFEAA